MFQKKLDLLTILERKKLSLFFVLKNRKRKIFEGWFVPSRGERLKIPTFNSELFKQSVVWSCCDVWNHCIQKLKIIDVDEVGYDVFIDSCENLFITDRAKIYV
ncbi:unnamed protein product [Orchesella dallaii]|uniref:Uncharacterized protein n=1 Tax=Orchesella dallaii TaxID=48710 RepID=A0ABP1QQV5_9HEXA